tara:strand:+ start:1493 stop:1888 length:396 start_codon:yes stop_codon:yes gene_type:complete
MSTLKADTIVASDGSSPVTLTKQTAAKHFINLDASSGTPTPLESFSVSSITDTATGKFVINIINNYSNANYSLAGYSNGVTSNSFSGSQVEGLGTSLFTTTTSGLYEFLSYAGGSYRDSKHCDTQGFGDLA